MALVEDSLGFLRIAFQPIAAEKKGGLYIPGLQPVQQPPGKATGGTVVKGQGNIAHAVGSPGGDGQKKGEKNRQNPAHGKHLPFFLFIFDVTGKMGYDIVWRDREWN